MLSNLLAIFAIIFWILVCRASDMRISEIRQKISKYSVESGIGVDRLRFGERPDDPGTNFEERSETPAGT